MHNSPLVNWRAFSRQPPVCQSGYSLGSEALGIIVRVTRRTVSSYSLLSCSFTFTDAKERRREKRRKIPCVSSLAPSRRRCWILLFCRSLSLSFGRDIVSAYKYCISRTRKGTKERIGRDHGRRRTRDGGIEVKRTAPLIVDCDRRRRRSASLRETR